MKNILFRDGVKWLIRLFVLLFSLTAISSHAIETITYYHTDSLGSPVAGTDESGALLWKEDYKPYGERIRKQVESDKNNRWYTGHPEDKETGLTYAGARFYDSVTGRFLAIDPVGFTEDNLQMFNRYAYANNNPYKYVDPDGRAIETAFDVVSFGLSINAFNSDPSFVNGLGVVYDGLATAIPFLPAGVGAIRHIGTGADAIRTVSKVEDATKSGSRLPNIETDVTRKEFEKNLLETGFKKSKSKDNKVSIFKKGDKKYATRSSSKSTKGPSVEVFKKNIPISKIRLGAGK